MQIDVAGKLFPNFFTIVVQLLATGVMFYVFKKYLWNAVLDFLDKRATFIESQIKEELDFPKVPTSLSL